MNTLSKLNIKGVRTDNFEYYTSKILIMDKLKRADKQCCLSVFILSLKLL